MNTQMITFILFGIFTVIYIMQFLFSFTDSQYWHKYSENYLKKITSLDATGPPKIAKNIIIFIGDGMGMSTISAARILKGQRKNQSGEEENLSFELFPNIGLSRTYNTDKQVPDSAGTATAIFSGIKTKTGVLGLDDTAGINTGTLGELTSIIDWGQLVGKRTGVVTTTRITHATPAALYSHIYKRDWECDSKIPEKYKISVKDIARQLFENAPGNKFNVSWL